MKDSREDIIRRKLEQFVKGNPHNILHRHEGVIIFDTPLVGFADVNDALFVELKKTEVIGEHHLLPVEWMPTAKTVISYFLPLSYEVRKSNLKPGLPSEQIVSQQLMIFNNMLKEYLIKLMKDMGGEAKAPTFGENFHWRHLLSNWSERHVAFIAGLGTFALNKAVITERGCAGRYGSVLTTLKISPTPRSYNKFDEYCLYLKNGSCGVCMKLCPAGAITNKGKNNWICKGYIDLIQHRFAPEYGCAKCQVGVPCETCIPS